MPESLVGMLLVASPTLLDPNFHRTVVLVCRHDRLTGAFGLVINRPLPEPVADHLPTWAPLAADPPVVFGGGPVEPGIALAVGFAPDGAGGEGWTPITGSLGLVDLATTPEAWGGRLERVRVFAGYAGWAAGQLEGELNAEAWFVLEASPEDVFGDPEERWRAVLRRQGGRLAMFAHFPDDPRLN